MTIVVRRVFHAKAGAADPLVEVIREGFNALGEQGVNLKFRILTDYLSGRTDRVVEEVEVESLAQFEAGLGQLMADPRLRASHDAAGKKALGLVEYGEVEIWMVRGQSNGSAAREDASEANKARSRRVFEEIASKGDLGWVDEVFAADFVNQPFGARGPEGVKQLVTTLRAGFPDITATVEEQVAEGDRVATRVTYRGTHEGSTALLGNLPPSGKPVVTSGIVIHRHADGRIVEGYSLLDALSMLRQIGAVPA